MSYLKMALRALESATDKDVDREGQTAGISNHVSDHTSLDTPQASLPKHILTCADCGFHEYQGPNPAHG